MTPGHHILAFLVLMPCDILFFIGVAIACDSIATLYAAVGAYLAALLVLTFRLARYMLFVQMVLLYRKTSSALPIPSTELQSALAAVSYSTLVAILVLLGAHRTLFVGSIWILALTANVVYALAVDDRPALREYITRHITRRRRGGDPTAERVTWSASIIPTSIAAATEADVWSDVSLSDSDETDVTEDIFSNMSSSRRDTLESRL